MAFPGDAEWDNDVESSSEGGDDPGRIIQSRSSASSHYVLGKGNSEVVIIHSEDDLREFITMDDLVVVFYFAKWSKNVEAVMAAYDRLSAEFDEDACLAVDVDELKNAKEIRELYQDVPAVRFYRLGGIVGKIDDCYDPDKLESTWRKLRGGVSDALAEYDGQTFVHQTNSPSSQQMYTYTSGPVVVSSTQTTTTTKTKKNPFGSFLKSVEKEVDKFDKKATKRSHNDSSSHSSAQVPSRHGTSSPPTASPGGATTTTTTSTVQSPRGGLAGVFGGKKETTTTATTHTGPTEAQIRADLERQARTAGHIVSTNGPPPPVPCRPGESAQSPRREANTMGAADRVADEEEAPQRIRAKPRTVAPSAGSNAPPPLPARDYQPIAAPSIPPRAQQTPVSPRNNPVSPRTSAQPSTSPRAPVVTRTPTSPRVNKEEVPRAQERRMAPPQSQPALKAAPRKSEPMPEAISRPPLLPDVPELNKDRYTYLECDWMMGHIKWHFQNVLKAAQVIRDHGLELSGDQQSLILRRILICAKEIKNISGTLHKIDTRFQSNANRQDALLANTTKLAESTVKFVSTCQNIAKGVAPADEFESAFTPLLVAANAVNNSLKFLHFDQGQKEFRLRRFDD